MQEDGEQELGVRDLIFLVLDLGDAVGRVIIVLRAVLVAQNRRSIANHLLQVLVHVDRGALPAGHALEALTHVDFALDILV